MEREEAEQDEKTDTHFTGVATESASLFVFAARAANGERSSAGGFGDRVH